jgi:putative phage-type endonuclease
MERTAFLERRKSGIGGSDVAAVLGVSKWKTPYQLWLDKTSDTVTEKESDLLHFGTVLEQVIADEYARRNNVKVLRRNQMFRHTEHPELIANIDRYIVGGKILECKTCSAYAADKFGEGGDEVPDEYLLQVQHYMHVTGYHEADLAVLIGGNEYRQFSLTYDADLANYAADKCVAFWNTYVVPQVPPPATANDDLASYFDAKAGATITATAEIAGLLEEYKRIKAVEKDAKADLEAIATQVKLFAGECEIIANAEGKTIATWKKGKDRATVDWKALAADKGITAEETAFFTKYSPIRTFTVK